MTQSLLFRIACLTLTCAVALGAFGAHGLKSRLSEEAYARYAPVWDTAATYQMYNALGLLAIAALWAFLSGPRVTPGIYCVMAGTVIFSVSLYTLVLTQTGWLGAITPIGGVAMMIGWILLATSTFQNSAQG